MIAVGKLACPDQNYTYDVQFVLQRINCWKKDFSDTLLGFTHYCGRTRYGRFVVKRKTHSKRLTTKLNALRQEAKRRMHTPVSDQHRWLCQVLRGHYAYYGLPSNFRCLMGFLHWTRGVWFNALRRRNQRRLNWETFGALLAHFSLPLPRITHPCAA
jgi:RNA-directed DNA polymerase